MKIKSLILSFRLVSPINRILNFFGFFSKQLVLDRLKMSPLLIVAVLLLGGLAPTLVTAQNQKNLSQTSAVDGKHSDLAVATIYASHGNVKMTVIKREKLAGKTILKSVESWLKNGDIVPIGAVIETAENSFVTLALSPRLNTVQSKLLKLSQQPVNSLDLDPNKITRTLGSLATLAARSSIKILSLPSYGSSLGVELLLLSGQVDSRVLSQEKNNQNNANSYYQVRAKLVTASVRGTHFRVALSNNDNVQSSVIEGSVDIGSINPQKLKEVENNSNITLAQYNKNHSLVASLTKNTGLILSSEDIINLHQNNALNHEKASPRVLLDAPEWLGLESNYSTPQVQLDWKPLKEINQYRIQIAKDEYFLDILNQKDITLNSEEKLKNVISTQFNIEAEGKYFTRISAFDKLGVEGNYKILPFTRENFNLKANARISDKNNSIYFYWNKLPIEKYHLIISSVDTKKKVFELSNITKENIEVNIDNFPAGRYEWQIKGLIQNADQQTIINSNTNQFTLSK